MSGVWKPTIKVLVGLVSSEASVLGLQLLPHVPCLSSVHTYPQCLCMPKWPLVRRTQSDWTKATLTASF